MKLAKIGQNGFYWTKTDFIEYRSFIQPKIIVKPYNFCCCMLLKTVTVIRELQTKNELNQSLKYVYFMAPLILNHGYTLIHSTGLGLFCVHPLLVCNQYIL